MNHVDRDKFYGFDDDDGVEYEVEPPDAEVIAAEKRRAEEAIVLSELAIDVDEIYREAGRRTELELGPKALGKFRFQFQVKHLLIATAVLAILLTLWKLEILGTVLGLLLVCGFAAALAVMELREHRQWVEAQRRFEEKYERRRRYLEGLNRGPRPKEGDTIYDDVPFQGNVSEPPLVKAPGRPRQLRFQFSMWQLLAAMTVASFVLGAMTILGGPANTATLLGFVALVGLAAHVLGADPPEWVVLGWWMLLVLYVIMSLSAAIVEATN
jgi:hypothetical protein